MCFTASPNLPTTTLTEVYNMTKVRFLYQIINHDENKDKIIENIFDKCDGDPQKIEIQRGVLNKFLELVMENDGVLTVNYHSTNEKREFADGGKSIQGISHHVREFLFEEEGLSDLDIKNSVTFHILAIVEGELELPTVFYYYHERQKIIDEQYGGDKQKCKDFVNSAFFTNWDIGRGNNEFEVLFKKDMKTLQEHFLNHELGEKFMEDAIKSCDERDEQRVRNGKKPLKNYRGALLCNIYHHMEAGTLNLVKEFIARNTNTIIRTLLFDGVIVELCDKFRIEDINKYVNASFDQKTKVIFEFKPIVSEEGIIPKMPDSFDPTTVRKVAKQPDPLLVKAMTESGNEMKWKSLSKKGVKITSTQDDEIADIIFEFMGDSFVYQDKNLIVYVEKDKSWRYDPKGEVSKVLFTDLMKSLYQPHMKSLFDKQQSSVDEDERKMIEKQIVEFAKMKQTILSANKQSAVFACLKNKLALRNDHVEFDVSLPYVLNFTNTAIDLRTGEEFEIKKEHYITQCTNYPYKKATDAQLQKIDEIVKSIQPKEDNRKTLLSILYNGLTGERLEKFFLAQGRGRNGKGLLNDLQLRALGPSYACNGNITLLTNKMKDGVNEELKSLHKKRFVKFEEPNDNDMILGGNMKKMSGEKTLAARGLYEQEGSVSIHAMFMFELNEKIKLLGRVDDSILERFTVLEYNQFFTTNEDDLANPDLECQRANPDYKEDWFQKDHKVALIEYLIKNAPHKLYLSQDVKTASRAYLRENDEILTWFTDTFERDPKNNEVLQIKDVYTKFQQSSYFLEVINKAERRKLNKQKFTETIASNMDLRVFYKERFRRTENGKQVERRHVLTGGWKPKKSELIVCEDAE